MIEEKSLDVFAAKLAQLRELFPEVLTEGKIDFNRLKDVLGDAVNFNKEHYELSWAGKSDARAQIQKATSATLQPDKSGIDAEGCQNIFIEGENLEVLHVLQRSYFGKIKMIYIDPPYNTGNDSFVYPDDYSERQDEYKKRAGITDKDGFLNKADLWKKNSKESGQFHSVWLSMMYPRLYLARNLLREDGVIFISIDDNEQANLKLLCDEIFGAENFVAEFPWKKRTAKSDVPFGVSQDYEWIFCYTKSGFNAGLEYERKYYQTPDYPNDGWRLSDLTKQTSADERPNSAFDMVNPKSGKMYPFNKKRVWAVSKDTFQDYYDKGKIVFPDDYDFLNISIPAYRVFESEDKEKALRKYGSEDAMKTASTQLPKEVGMSENGNKEIVDLFASKIFSFPKPSSLIKHFLQIANDKNALVLDFFSGSGTTAHAVLDLNEQDSGNRQFICVQLPELLEENSEAYKAGYKTIADICKARITKVIEKIQTERDNNKQTDLIPESQKQILGFKSFKLAPSNFKQWRGDIDENELLTQLELFKDSEQAYSENYSMLIELLLKAGFPLTANVEINTVAGQELYNVESGKVLFFFDDYNEKINDFIFNLKPKSVVCLNRVFKNNDTALTNFQLSLKDAGIELQII